MKSNHRTPSGLLIFAALVAPAFGQAIQRVSLGQGGVQAEAESGFPSVSGDARYVAFESAATNLVPGDTNDYIDVFVRDRFAGTTERVSLGAQGQEGNHNSYMPSISARGRYVAFVSVASNLAPGDTPNTWDVFFNDRHAGLTRCVSVNLAGVPGTGEAGNPAVSIDGRFVAFNSDAQDLVPGPQAGCSQVYMRDVLAGTTECVSVTPSGAQGSTWSAAPSMSANGRFVAFISSFALDGGGAVPYTHVFVRDRWSGTTIRASRSTSGAEANGAAEGNSISNDGRYIAFTSSSTNLGPTNPGHINNVYVRDMLLGTTTWVSHGPGGVESNGGSGGGRISPSGRYVIFTSVASNILPGDVVAVHDVFRWDRVSGQTRLVSADASGAWGNEESSGFGVTNLGRVVFTSTATNLVPGDTNGVLDVFVKAP